MIPEAPIGLECWKKSFTHYSSLPSFQGSLFQAMCGIQIHLLFTGTLA
jgi:hypothetical protein